MKDVAQALKFAKGAVSKKDFVLELTHFRIKDKKVMAFNGRLSLCHPIDLDFEVSPKAVFFEKALIAVPDNEPVSITVTKANRLSVKAGNFRVLVHCHENMQDSLFPQPEGILYDIDLDLLSIFEDVYPFTAEDASRPWAQAVKIEGHSAYATNNNVLIERWCEKASPLPFVVSKEVVREMLRIGIEPNALQVSDSSATFHFPNGAWLRTQFLSDPWPNLEPVINQPMTGLKDAPANFYEDMKRLETFCEDSGIIQLKGATMSTTTHEGEGASIDLPEELGEGAFHIRILLKIASIATKVDFNNAPAVFVAPRIRGVAMGTRR